MKHDFNKYAHDASGDIMKSTIIRIEDEGGIVLLLKQYTTSKGRNNVRALVLNPHVCNTHRNPNQPGVKFLC